MNHGEKSKIQTFTDLNVWKESHKLVLEIYSLTKNFPKEEMFGLAMQLRRAVVSITSNTQKVLAGSHIRINCTFIVWL